MMVKENLKNEKKKVTITYKNRRKTRIRDTKFKKKMKNEVKNKRYEI